jgi:hypothetical protein
MNFYALSFLF